MTDWMRQVLLLLVILGQCSTYGQSTNFDFFSQVDLLMEKYVEDSKVNYSGIHGDPLFKDIVAFVKGTPLEGIEEASQKAYLINAYNIMVLQGVSEIYPTTSVQKTFGFFDNIKRVICGEEITLNAFEKTYLLDKYADPRLHFVLVCGAIGCPPLINEAYTPDQLDFQLDRQTKLALNNPDFIRAMPEEIALSQIFEWYPNDFGGSKKAILEYINQYKSETIDLESKISYYGYDWRLNDISTSLDAANANRYIVSSAIPKSTAEVKIFNNLYSQKTGANGDLTDRSTFFTTSISAIYGITNRFNAGIEIRYRRVFNSGLSESPLGVFKGGLESGSFRQGITAIGPRIRFAPFPSWRNFSIQSTLSFPIGKDLAGTAERPYIDWNGVSFNTQLFNDKALGSSFSLFTELDFFIEDMGPSIENHANRFSTPITVILSYFPNSKTTLYGLVGYSPYWQSTYDYFIQGGIGAKYQFTPKFELELLYTGFSNKFLANSRGQAATYNFGIRSNF